MNILSGLFPSITFRVRTGEKKIFLTFDDGPVPEATPEVLDLLSDAGAKATFFCIGQNIQKHPKIFQRIISEGHMAGNHTFNHLNGWRTSRKSYLDNAEECRDKMIAENGKLVSFSLFRPPYGKLKPAQYFAIRKQYKIVMWDVLTRDWEENRSPDSCFQRIKFKVVPGSIIVFHDSIKAKTRMIPALQMTLKHFSELGYSFESLEKYT